MGLCIGGAYYYDSYNKKTNNINQNEISTIEELQTYLQNHIDYMKELQEDLEKCQQTRCGISYTCASGYTLYYKRNPIKIDWNINADLGSVVINLKFYNFENKPSKVLTFLEEARKNKVFLKTFGANGLKYFEKDNKDNYVLTFAYNAQHCPSYYNRKRVIDDKIDSIRRDGKLFQKLKLKFRPRQFIQEIEKEAPIVIPNKNCYLNKMPLTQLPHLFEKYSPKKEQKTCQEK